MKRQSLGLSAGGLSEKAGVCRSYISKLEHGQISEPSLKTFSKIALALNLTPMEIFMIIHAEVSND